MARLSLLLITWIILAAATAQAEPVRGAYPSANVQFLPAFVALEKGFYKREGLDAELISVRNAVTAVQALLGNQIHFIFSVGPQMPSIWEGAEIILLAQMIGRPTFSMVVTQDIQKVTDLKGKKIGVSFGGSTFAGTKALLELYKMNPEKDVQYVSIPGSQPKIAAMQQGIIQAALARAAVRLRRDQSRLQAPGQFSRSFQGYFFQRSGRHRQNDQRESAIRQAHGARDRARRHP